MIVSYLLGFKIHHLFRRPWNPWETACPHGGSRSPGIFWVVLHLFLRCRNPLRLALLTATKGGLPLVQRMVPTATTRGRDRGQFLGSLRDSYTAGGHQPPLSIVCVVPRSPAVLWPINACAWSSVHVQQPRAFPLASREPAAGLLLLLVPSLHLLS